MKLLMTTLAVLCLAPLPAVAEKAITLTAQVRGMREGPKGKWTGFPVFANDTMKSGDQLEIFVNVKEPAYVYVLQFFPDGTSEVLFPQACPAGASKPPANCGHVQAQPGKALRVPESGEAFQLDEQKGIEHVYFVASRDPIDQADKAISKVINDVRKQSADLAAAAPATPPAPPAKVDPSKKVDPKVEPPKVKTNPERKTTEPTKKPGQTIAAIGGPLVKPGAMLDAGTRKIQRVKQADGQQATEAEAMSDAARFVVLHFQIKHE